MIRNKKICPKCNREISLSNFKKHTKICNGKVIIRYSLYHNSLKCQFCGKLCKSRNSLCNHEIRCKNNPNKLININYRNGMTGKTAWNKGLNKNNDPRIAKSAQTYHKNYLDGKYDYSHNKHSEKTKEKIRQQKLELCAKQETNLCGKGLRGYYKGYYCQSSWELAYVIYNLEHNVNFVRNKKGFKYILDNIERTYFPDFYLPDQDIYIEIKGYYDRKTGEKEKQFKGKLKVLKYLEMKPILDYVVSKYGKDYTILYENSLVA